jgi:hypothetical protein
VNFENYNKIYQEILTDEKNELSANYLLNKYEIIHDEELINILNQIKKNEYISSDNKVINNLLKELDENEDLLDVNEIINVKNKVINPKTMDNFLKNEENENISSDIDIEEEIIQKKQKKSSKINLIIENIKEKISLHDIKEKSIENVKKYKFYSLPIILLLGIFFIFSNLYSENKSLLIEKEKLEKTIQKNELIKEKNTVEIIDKIEPTEEKIIPYVNNQEPIFVENTESIEEKLNVLDDTQNNQLPNKINNEILLNSLEEISKYIKEFKYIDGKLEYKNDTYSENDILFGFKIYKLSSAYVKFQDEKNKIRKTFILNN